MKLFSHLSIALVALPMAAWAVIPGEANLARQEASNATPDTRSEAVQPGMPPAGSDLANPDLAWVDPVITGPVSPGYKRVREAAHCDEAKWPHIPAVCYPD
jgi:hypothetical protein